MKDILFQKTESSTLVNLTTKGIRKMHGENQSM